jgi:hypothetical protein
MPNSPRLRRALAACENGTAHLDQYAMIFEETVEASRMQIFASVPALVAREDAGGRLTPESALAYPPQVPLPDAVARQVDDLFAFFTSPSITPLATEGPRAAFAWWRAKDAALALALGVDALELRHRAWQDGPEGAAPSSEVIEPPRLPA